MDIFNDHRTVLTFDAGGTNFVFSAMVFSPFLCECWI